MAASASLPPQFSPPLAACRWPEHGPFLSTSGEGGLRWNLQPFLPSSYSPDIPVFPSNKLRVSYFVPSAALFCFRRHVAFTFVSVLVLTVSSSLRANLALILDPFGFGNHFPYLGSFLSETSHRPYGIPMVRWTRTPAVTHHARTTIPLTIVSQWFPGPGPT